MLCLPRTRSFVRYHRRTATQLFLLLQATFHLDILGVKKNPSSSLYTQLGVMTKGTSLPSRLLDLQVFLRSPPYSPRFIKVLFAVLLRVPIALPRRYGYKALGCLVLYLAWCGLRFTGLHVVWLRAAAQAVLDALPPAA